MTIRPLNFITFTNPLVARPTRRHNSVTPVTRRPLLVASHTLNGKKIEGPVQPSNHNIMIKIGEATDVTSGGIILPDDAQEKPTFGEAVQVGPGKFLGNGIKIPMQVHQGDIVMYGKYGGTNINYDGDRHTIITQDDVLCKFKGGDYTEAACDPIFDRLLVKVVEQEDETIGGLFISNTAKEKPICGHVVAMGPGRFMENGEVEPATIALGDLVYYGSYAGTAVTLENEEYLVIRVSDVFAKA